MALAKVAGPVDVPLLRETIPANLARTVERCADKDALVVVHQEIRQTYAQLAESIDTTARGLLSMGVEVGDRVGIWAPNCAEWVHLQYATAAIGAILVNINPAYRVSELEYALSQSGCRVLVSAPSYKSSDYRDMISETWPRLPALDQVIFLDSEEWDGLLSAGESVSVSVLRARTAELDHRQPINIQYTSGTTGFPKGATLSHLNILNNGFFVGEGCGYSRHDRVCIPVPFYHCFGMVLGNLACTTHGAAMVIPGASFEEEAVLSTVESERCTSLYGVPTMFIAELEHPDFPRFDLRSLRTGIMAGAPCPVEVMKRVVTDMHMEDVTICYGMTETSPVSTQTTTHDDLEHRVSTVGRVHPHVEIRIVDPETGETVEVGVAGELCTRGYSVMLGYWEDPERTAETIDAEGWLHSGDLATLDDDGYVRIVGRIKDMIIRGGENIYPREIEEFLLSHPDILDVQVVGVPDSRYGEEVMAFIRPRPGATLSEEDVRAFCVGRIAHYKVPRYVGFSEEFPMTVTGKVQKFRLREEAMERLGLTADDREPVATGTGRGHGEEDLGG